MICPRCDSVDAYMVFEAEDKSWEVFRCPRCNFNWRSTEESGVTDAKLYDLRFKLDEEKIRQMVPKPPIPPLRAKK